MKKPCKKQENEESHEKESPETCSPKTDQAFIASKRTKSRSTRLQKPKAHKNAIASPKVYEFFDDILK